MILYRMSSLKLEMRNLIKKQKNYNQKETQNNEVLSCQIYQYSTFSDFTLKNDTGWYSNISVFFSIFFRCFKISMLIFNDEFLAPIG